MPTSRYYVPPGRSVGRPGGGIYRSDSDVPAKDIEALGPETVALYVRKGRFVDRDAAPAAEVQPPEPAGRTGPVSPGKWVRDPSLLEGKSLGELNVMVLEIDGEMKPFETVEEAIAQLSMDFAA